MIIDLHQDRSDNGLSTTHKDFFSKEENIHGRNMEGMNALNHVTLEKLQTSGVSAVITALFIEPDTMKATDNLFSKGKQPLEAATYEIHRHNKYYDYLIKYSKGKLQSILNAEDLDQCISNNNIGLIKHIEGYYIQEPGGNFDMLDSVYNAGIRSIGLTRNEDNVLATASHKGPHSGGLTSLGKEFILKLQEKGMIIDLAHLSRMSVDDVLELTSGPLMVSHTALTSERDDHRFLTVDQAKKVANGGGVVGLAVMEHLDSVYPLKDIEDYVDQLGVLVDLIGEDHVCLGTDFDGLEADHVISGFDDASEYHLIEQGLEKKGHSTTQIEKIMGGNAKRFIKDVL